MWTSRLQAAYHVRAGFCLLCCLALFACTAGTSKKMAERTPLPNLASDGNSGNSNKTMTLREVFQNLSQIEPAVDIVSSMAVVAEVELDGRSKEVIGKREDQKYFRRGSLSQLLLEQVASYRRSLESTDNELCTLALMAIDLGYPAEHKSGTEKRHKAFSVCLLKGEMLRHLGLEEPDLTVDGDKKFEMLSSHQGIVMSFGFKPGKAGSKAMAADIHLVFLIYTGKGFDIEKKTLRVERISEGQWKPMK